MTIHLIKDIVPPAVPPIELGCHYIDTVNKKSYISVGTLSVADWKETSGGGTVPGGAVDSVFGRVGDIVAQVGDYTAAQVGAYTTAQVDTALAGKVSSNAPIVGQTHTKITYDSKGLVVFGANLAPSDLPIFAPASATVDGGPGAVPAPAMGDQGKFLRGDGVWAVTGGGGGGGAVDSVNGYTGVVVLTKNDIGLSNVNNTSDANKPISTATQTALDAKVDENAPITGGTFPKITFDAKGLVTAGSALAAADLPLFIGATGVAAGTRGAVPPPSSGQTTLFLRSDGTWASTPAAPVTSVNGQTGVVVLTKTDVGLSNVDNTSDLNKPVSNATQTALNAKLDKNASITPGTSTKVTYDAKGLITGASPLTGSDIPSFTGATAGSAGTRGGVPLSSAGDQLKFLRADGTWQSIAAGGVNSVNGQTGDVTLTKSDLGLANVDNTSDANKPISSATQTALDAKVDSNAAISAGTATKITYDAKGLVTAGTTLDVTDIPTFTPASAGAGGTTGGVPVSLAGDQGKYLRADGTWQTIAAGASVAGSNTQVQFNNSGAFGASANFTWDNAAAQLVVSGSDNVATTPTFTVRDNAGTVEFQVRNTGLIFGQTIDTGTVSNTVRIGPSTFSTGTPQDGVLIGRSAGVAAGATFSQCVFIGALSGNKATTAQRCAGIGQSTLQNLTSGTDNTAFGVQALQNITTVTFNAAFGTNALRACTGGSNTGVGTNAGVSSIDGVNNVFLGSGAASSVQYVNNGTYLGTLCVGTNGTSGLKTSNEIVIGASAVGRGTNTATYGTAAITSHQFTGGDVIILGQGKGITLKSPDGSITKKLTIDNTGAIALI